MILQTRRRRPPPSPSTEGYFRVPLVSRALGIPCRVITNFASAHDSNNNLVIERYVDENGDLVQSKEMIWYEVWFQWSAPGLEGHQNRGLILCVCVGIITAGRRAG